MRKGERVSVTDLLLDFTRKLFPEIRDKGTGKRKRRMGREEEQLQTVSD